MCGSRLCHAEILTVGASVINRTRVRVRRRSIDLQALWDPASPTLLGEKVERALVALDGRPETRLEILVGAPLLDAVGDRLTDHVRDGRLVGHRERVERAGLLVVYAEA